MNEIVENLIYAAFFLFAGHNGVTGEGIGRSFGRVDDFQRHAVVDFADRLEGHAKPDCGFALNHHLDRPGTGFGKLLKVFMQPIDVLKGFFFTPEVHPVLIEEITGTAGFGIGHGDQIAVPRVKQFLIGLRCGEAVFAQNIAVDDDSSSKALPDYPFAALLLWRQTGQIIQSAAAAYIGQLILDFRQVAGFQSHKDIDVGFLLFHGHLGSRFSGRHVHDHDVVLRELPAQILLYVIVAELFTR